MTVAKCHWSDPFHDRFACLRQVHFCSIHSTISFMFCIISFELYRNISNPEYYFGAVFMGRLICLLSGMWWWWWCWNEGSVIAILLLECDIREEFYCGSTLWTLFASSKMTLWRSMYIITVNIMVGDIIKCGWYCQCFSWYEDEISFY